MKSSEIIMLVALIGAGIAVVYFATRSKTPVQKAPAAPKTPGLNSIADIKVGDVVKIFGGLV